MQALKLLRDELKVQLKEWRKIRRESYKLIFKTPLRKQSRKGQRAPMLVDSDKRNGVY